MSGTEAPTREAPDACRRCGEPLASFRFCLNCGAPVHADELGRAEPTAASRSRVRRVLGGIVRWRTPLVVLPLLAGLAIAGGIGARMLTEEIPTPETRSEVTCWDGGAASSADGCTAPNGVAGLRWVFPTFHPERDDCVDVLIEHPEYQRPAMYECDVEVSQHWATVTYMQLADVDAGRRYFQRAFPDSKPEKVRTADGTPYRHVWRQPSADGYELAAMYTDFPYAVTISADAAKHRDQALRRLTFRHPDQILVVGDPS